MDLPLALNWILTVCGAIAAIGGATIVLKRWMHPAISFSDRLKMMEERGKDNLSTLQEIKERDALIMEALVILMNNQISGNNIEQVKQIRDKLISYLAQHH